MRSRLTESARSDAPAQDAPPDPFEDLAAPSLRLTPRPERPRVLPFPKAGPAAPQVALRPAAPDPGPEAAQAPAVRPGPQAIRALPPSAHGASSRSRREVSLALLVGFVIAAAIVAGAIYLRQAPVEPEAALGSAPVPAEEALQVAATPISDVTVRLRLPAGVDAARTQALREALTGAGFARVDVSTLSQPIGAPRVEYAHPQDRAAAETLAEALSPLAEGGLTAEALPDQTGSGPVGHIDLWMER